MVAAIGSLQLAPILARRIRPAYLFSGGLAVAVAGLLVMTQTSATAGPAVLVVGFVLASFGAGPLVALGVNLVVSSAPPPKAGSAAGVAQTGNEFGYALGIATRGSIGAFVYRSQLTDTIPTGLPAQAVHAARESLAGATAAAGQLPDQLATALLAIAREAFTSGLHAVAAVAALVLAGVAILILATLRHLPPSARPSSTRPKRPHPQPSPTPTTATRNSPHNPSHVAANWPRRWCWWRARLIADFLDRTWT